MKKLSAKDYDKLKYAIDLQKKDEDEKALSILYDLEKNNPNNTNVLGFIGLVLAKVERRKESIPYLEKTLKLNSKYEHFHLSLYVSYAEIEEYEKAINILFNYLENNPADLFKDTLEELLDGLLSEYGTIYRDKIIFYAKKNDVYIPNKLII